MKKIAFIILAMLLPILANGATTKFQVNGISYETLEEDNQAVKVISGSTKYSGDIVIPPSVTYGGKTYQVKKIGKWAFWECTGLKSIVLPEGLEEIENSSFTGCTGMKAITFPSTLRAILGINFTDERGAFEGCTGLKSVYFPANMSTDYQYEANIGWRSFYGCTGLKTIYVAGSKTAIAMYDVFGECTAVTDFVSCIENPKAVYVDARSFQGFIETANLIVPNGKKNDYLDSNDWYLFKHIYERSSYTKAFAIVTASQGGKVSFSNENVTIGTQVWGITKGQNATFTITPDESHRLLKLLKDGQDVTSSVSNGQYTISNVQSDFMLEAFFEEGTTPTPQPQPQDKGTAQLSIKSFDIKAGETKTMLIDMQNPDDQVTLVQFDLRLPDGLSIVTGNDATDIAGRTTWRKHTLTSNATNGITRFLLYSATNELIEGTSGAIISIKLTASSLFNGGDIKLENQLMTTPSLVESKPTTYTYNIKGTENPPASDGEPYVVYNNGTLTFYCDNQRSSRQGTVYDLNKDTKNPGWLEHKENVKKAVFDASFTNARPTTTYSWFDNCKNLSDIQGISYLNTSEVTRMEWMFRDCSSLTSIDVSGFNTSNVGPIGGLFFGCSGLTNLDLSSFNTSNVWSMSQMFNGCSNLVSLTFGSSFTTSESVTNQSVFYNCGKLNTVIFTGDIPSQMKSTFFVGVGSEKTPATLHVPDAYKTNFQAKFDGNKFFGGYFKLSGDTPAGDGEPYVVYNNGTLTFYCDNKRSSRQGTVYDLGQKYDINKYTKGPAWLENRESINKAVFNSSFANARPKTTASWFYKCSAMTDIEGIAYLNTSNVTDMNAMFYHCSGLTNLDVSNFNTSNVTNIGQMFYGCSGLTSLDVSNFNTSNVTVMNSMFDGCSGLTSLDVSHFNTSNVTDMNGMFYDCSSLTSLDVSKFNTGNVTKMRFMFSGCKNLSKLTLGNGFVSSEDLECRNFTGCSSLKTVAYTGDIPYSINSKFFEGVGTANAPVTLEVPDQYRDHYAAKFDGNMFFGGYFKLSGDNPPAGDGESYVVYNNGTLTFYCDDQRSSRQGTTYDLPEESNVDPVWYKEHARDIKKAVFDKSFANARPTFTHRWFDDCHYLTDIQGIENLNTSEVTYMLCMFANCWALESIDLSSFDVSKVGLLHGMFVNCRSLKTIDLSNFYPEDLYNMYAMFEGCENLTEIKFGNIDTKGVRYMNSLFKDCKSLETITFGEKFVSSEKTECDLAFEGCKNLKTINFTGDIPVSINKKFFEGVGTADNPVKLNVPDQYKDNYAAKFVGNMFYGGYFTLREAIVPDEKGGKDYGSGNSEIDEKTNLDGSVIGNVYYSIAPENGGYNSAEGCLVVTKPSSDNAFEIDDPFGNDFKGMFTGIMIMVQQGSGIVKVEAETLGGMTLMVKVGNGLPIQMTMLSKSTLAIPYSVDRPTYIYIYAGGSNGNARTRADSDGQLKIYSISWESSASGINSLVGEEQLYDVYSLSGTLIKRRVTSLDALPKGVYIVNGRKVVVK